MFLLSPCPAYAPHCACNTHGEKKNCELLPTEGFPQWSWHRYNVTNTSDKIYLEYCIMSGETRPGVNLVDFSSLWFRPEGRVKAQHHYKQTNRKNKPKKL